MLRIGIILTVTGIIVFAHLLLTKTGLVPRRTELFIAIGFVVVGVPLLVAGLL